MQKNFNQYTYSQFLKTGNILNEYKLNNTKITVCKNYIKNFNRKNTLFINLKF